MRGGVRGSDLTQNSPKRADELMSETYAHLEHLRLAGQAKATSVDGRLEYVVE